MTDQARNEFNAWWSRQPFNAQFEDVKAKMFNVWLASRAECVVDLPKREDEFFCCHGSHTWDRCAKAIEASGLKVRQ